MAFSIFFAVFFVKETWSLRRAYFLVKATAKQPKWARFTFFSKHDKFVCGFLLLCNQTWEMEEKSFFSDWPLKALLSLFLFLQFGILKLYSIALLSFFGFALCVFSSLYFEPLGTFLYFPFPCRNFFSIFTVSE